MPNETDFHSDEVSKPGSYIIQNREQGQQQASVTYKVTSVGKKSLGKDGERFGIAKRNAMDPYDKYLQDVENFNNDKNLGEKEKQQKSRELDDRKLRLEETAKTTFNALYLQNLQVVTTEQMQQTHLLSRAVASSRVDDLLGTQVLSQEKFGQDENGKVVGISVGVDGVSATGTLPEGGNYILDIDYSDPAIQKGLSDLEAVDYITGQMDRHTGNIFIDPVTKQVKGIDNDLAFPGVERKELVASKDETVSSKLVGNLPRYLHTETARKIERVTEEELRNSLSSVKHPGSQNGKLTPGEIDGAVQRLKELQGEIKVMRKEGRVVTGFTRETYEKSIQTQEKVAQQIVESKLSRQRNGIYKNDEFVPESAIRNVTLQGLEQCTKTSYLGSLHVRKMKSEHALDPVAKLKPDAFEEHGINSKIPRSPQAVEFQRLSAPIKQEYEAQHREKNMEQYMKLEKQIMEYKDRLNDLQRSGPTAAKFKSLRYGGVDKAIDEFNKKLGDASVKLMDLNLDRDKQVASRMDVVSERLWDKAVQNVPYVDRQEVNNAQRQQVGNQQVQGQVQGQGGQQVGELNVPPQQNQVPLRQDVVEFNDVLRNVKDKDLGVDVILPEQDGEDLSEMENHEQLESIDELEAVDELEELVEFNNDLEELSVDEPSHEQRTTVKDVLEKKNQNQKQTQHNHDDHSVATMMGYDRNKKPPTVGNNTRLHHHSN